MPTFERAETSIHYEVTGDGPPILMLAPGGLRLSRIDNWDKAPWDPIAALADRYRLVAMDQRNTGRSFGPIRATDGWDTYAADQLALMDHLGIERFAVVGMCIGAGFGLHLADAAPERVSAVVAMQPIGNADNRDAYRGIFEEWRESFAADHPEATDEDWEGTWTNLFGSDRLLWTVPDEAIGALQPPVLVLQGADQFHPTSASRAVADHAPNATLIEQWKAPEDQPAARAAVDDFLAAHAA